MRDAPNIIPADAFMGISTQAEIDAVTGLLRQAEKLSPRSRWYLAESIANGLAHDLVPDDDAEPRDLAASRDRFYGRSNAGDVWLCVDKGWTSGMIEIRGRQLPVADWTDLQILLDLILQANGTKSVVDERLGETAEPFPSSAAEGTR